jgi:adenosine kinase
VDLDNVKEVFMGYQGINLKHMTCKNDQGDIISLKFLDMNNRIERQTGFMDPIMPSDVKNILSCRAFVFIPISDYEISLDTLKFLKANSKGTIIFDAHGPTTACLFTCGASTKILDRPGSVASYIDAENEPEEAHASWFKRNMRRVNIMWKRMKLIATPSGSFALTALVWA